MMNFSCFGWNGDGEVGIPYFERIWIWMQRTCFLVFGCTEQ
jgi:hypothetical protein